MKLPSWIQNPWLSLLCRVVVALLFLYAAIAKIDNPVGFSTQVARYELFPITANLTGILFPWIELILGLSLLVGLWPRASALGISFLMGLFLVAGILALARGLKIDCGCFGDNDPLTVWTLLRDGLIFLPVLQVLFSPSRRWVLLEG